jgi:DNA-binding XRE family transcriptional regulator
MKLKDFRHIYDLTQPELGLLLGITERQVRNIENNISETKPSLLNIINTYLNFIGIEREYEDWMAEYSIEYKKNSKCYAIVFSDPVADGSIVAAINVDNFPKLVLESYIASSNDESVLDPYLYNYYKIDDAIATL